MRNHLIMLLVVILLPGTLRADGNQALFETANLKYAEGLYEEAIVAYQQILETGQESTEVYYNLGNAWFKTGQITKAILNYERGLLLSPGDEDIRYNLSIANELITDKIEQLPGFFLSDWIRSLSQLLSANMWALFSLISFLILSVLIPLLVLSRRRQLKNLFLSAILLTLVISSVSLLFARQQSKIMADRNTAIVFSPSVTVKSSPDSSGTNLFILHEGVKVEIIDRISGWYEIRIADGNLGWMPAEAVEII